MVFPWFSHLFHPFPAQPMIIFTQCSVSTAASSSSWEGTDKRVVLEEALGLAQSDININIIYIYIYIKRERDKLIFIYIYILDIYIYIYIWKYGYIYICTYMVTLAPEPTFRIVEWHRHVCSQKNRTEKEGTWIRAIRELVTNLVM